MDYRQKTIGIVGLPFSEIDERPLETLVGIRVRTWALFEMLPNYGFDTYLYVDPEIPINQNVIKGYGKRLIRSRSEFLSLCSGEFNFTIFCATKMEYLLFNHPWLMKICGAKVLGVFCYDNNRILDPNILHQMVSTTFTTPIQKQLWERRQTGVPAFLVTTGQIAQPTVGMELTSDSVFIGELRSLRVLWLLCEIAKLMPDNNKIYLATQRIIEQRDQNRVYLDLTGFSENDGRNALSEFIESMGFFLPSNLIYKNIPYGQEKKLLDQVTVGLDFSWSDNYNIENSKVSRYLTYGLFPIVELPSPSHRYLTFFNTGQKLSYNAPAADWVAAIEASSHHDLISKNRLRQKSGIFFNWEKVGFEIGSYLQPYTDRHTKPNLLNRILTSLHLLSIAKKVVSFFSIGSSINLFLRQRQRNILLLLQIILGKRLKKFNKFLMLLDPTEYIDNKLLNEGSFEVETVRWLTFHLPLNGIFVDVGANNGYFSFFAREIVGSGGRIIAIEPTSYGIRRFQEILKLNSYSNIELYKLAFSDRKRSKVDITYHPEEYQTGTDQSIRSSWKLASSGVYAVHAGKADSCDFLSLDEFVLTHHLESIDVIKIDVDGGEENVLAGAMKTIDRLKPTLIIELNWERNIKLEVGFSLQLKQILSRLFEYGYSAFNSKGEKFVCYDELSLFLRSVADQPTSPNLLFVYTNLDKELQNSNNKNERLRF